MDSVLAGRDFRRGVVWMKINKKFKAKLEKSSNKGGWTYVVWPGAAGQQVACLEMAVARHELTGTEKGGRGELVN